MMLKMHDVNSEKYYTFEYFIILTNFIRSDLRVINLVLHKQGVFKLYDANHPQIRGGQDPLSKIHKHLFVSVGKHLNFVRWIVNVILLLNTTSLCWLTFFVHFLYSRLLHLMVVYDSEETFLHKCKQKLSKKNSGTNLEADKHL